MKFPREAPKRKVIRVLKLMGFRTVRVGNHISMSREDADGSRTPLTVPNCRIIKGPTLRAICRQAGISRDEFLKVYEEA